MVCWQRGKSGRMGKRCTRAARRGQPGAEPTWEILLEAAAYRRLLIRLIALPIAALALLALTLAFGFRLVQRSARRVDRADQVIAHANNLIKLMVDEETGLRGFLITHDADFLTPYKEANEDLKPEFA